jgi:hypothetical protein
MTDALLLVVCGVVLIAVGVDVGALLEWLRDHVWRPGGRRR